jgi:hypothetical protein
MRMGGEGEGMHVRVLNAVMRETGKEFCYVPTTPHIWRLNDAVLPVIVSSSVNVVVTFYRLSNRPPLIGFWILLYIIVRMPLRACF